MSPPLKYLNRTIDPTVFKQSYIEIKLLLSSEYDNYDHLLTWRIKLLSFTVLKTLKLSIPCQRLSVTNFVYFQNLISFLLYIQFYLVIYRYRYLVSPQCRPKGVLANSLAAKRSWRTIAVFTMACLLYTSPSPRDQA